MTQTLSTQSSVLIALLPSGCPLLAHCSVLNSPGRLHNTGSCEVQSRLGSVVGYCTTTCKSISIYHSTYPGTLIFAAGSGRVTSGNESS